MRIACRKQGIEREKKKSDIQESFIEAADKRTNITKEEKWKSTQLLFPPSHYEVQNRRNLTRQYNESRREREWKEEGKREIMKTSLISPDTSPHLSCHCWNQYKFHCWDVLKNAWLWETFPHAVTLTRSVGLFAERRHESKNLNTFAQQHPVKCTGGMCTSDFQSIQWGRTGRFGCRSEENTSVPLPLVAHCAF